MYICLGIGWLNRKLKEGNCVLGIHTFILYSQETRIYVYMYVCICVVHVKIYIRMQDRISMLTIFYNYLLVLLRLCVYHILISVLCSLDIFSSKLRLEIRHLFRIKLIIIWKINNKAFVSKLRWYRFNCGIINIIFYVGYSCFKHDTLDQMKS